MPRTITDEDRARIRREFPALASDTVFLENAGGSQVPRRVADRIHRYLLSTNVQLGAGYPLSQTATRIVDEAHDFFRLLMNVEDGHVIFGSSTSALLRMLADCYADVLAPGQEIVLARDGHEANLGPWKRLESRGIAIRWWDIDPATATCPLETLDSLLSDRTAVVAFPHVSNLVGWIADVPAIANAAHRVGARVVVDAVAYAPHRAVDVAGWDVDWYAFSTYKVYGPHMAVLYGRSDALSALKGPNHFFVPDDDLPYKFELGGACHEGCAGLLGLADYLNVVADRPAEEPIDRGTIEEACAIMAACEQPLKETLIDYLVRKPRVHVVGPTDTGDRRVGTISFIAEGKSSRAITEVVDRTGIAIRHGHMYAYHLCEDLGLDPEDGVVRTSFVHYNTPDEIDRLIEVFETVL